MKTILIVEDDGSLQESLVEQIRSSGFNVSTANNGEDGLKKALLEKPNLILLDVFMPKMNGLSMMEKLRADKWGNTVPIIILSNIDPGSSKILEQININHPSFYIVKSNFKLSEIVDKINEVLSTKEKLQ